jgi:hypothetical protein
MAPDDILNIYEGIVSALYSVGLRKVVRFRRSHQVTEYLSKNFLFSILELSKLFGYSPAH